MKERKKWKKVKRKGGKGVKIKGRILEKKDGKKRKGNKNRY